jgi:hypothetical protein
MGCPMPRYKVLKGVAHNIGHSFTSLMNYAKDDYTMGHILRFARESGKDSLVIDLVSGEGRPPELLRDPISQAPQWYSKMFWNMVVRSGSDRTFVQSATLTLKYDLTRVRQPPGTRFHESPYTCEVAILDNRDKTYAAYFSGWWYPERTDDLPRHRFWWNPFGWFRRHRTRPRM